MQNKVIVLEFNELVPHLLDRFIAEGRLPNFKRLRDEGIVAVTDAVEEPPYLEPWIQWVTVHTGLTYAEHKCFALNEGAKFKAPRIWDMVSDAGKTVWVCGSMNAGVQSPAIRGKILPDPWADGVTAIPEDYFEPYTKLVRAYVQEHSTGKPDVSPADVLRFGRFMIANGLSAKTVWNTLRQLASERRDKTQWRRATILDQLQWDLFRAVYKSEQPTFATFFLNSTAHFQHFHWREMEPDLFTVKSSDEDMRVYGETIAFGYEQMDQIVGEALALAGNDTSVVLCTALSQKPMLHMEDVGGRQLFRQHDIDELLAWAGITAPYEYSPVMSQQFHLTFQTKEDCADALRKLAAIRMVADGAQVMLAAPDGDLAIASGCMIDVPPAQDAMVTSGASNEQRRFWDVFYPLDALRSGMHDPDGVFWARLPSRQHVVLDRKLSLLDLAPTFLALSGVESDHAFSGAAIPEVLNALAPSRIAA